MSPWFMSKGRMTSFHGNPYWVPPEPINIIIGSQSDDVIGQPIFFAFFDEISYLFPDAGIIKGINVEITGVTKGMKIRHDLQCIKDLEIVDSNKQGSNKIIFY